MPVVVRAIVHLGSQQFDDGPHLYLDFLTKRTTQNAPPHYTNFRLYLFSLRFGQLDGDIIDVVCSPSQVVRNRRGVLFSVCLLLLLHNTESVRSVVVFLLSLGFGNLWPCGIFEMPHRGVQRNSYK